MTTPKERARQMRDEELSALEVALRAEIPKAQALHSAIKREQKARARQKARTK